MNATTLSFVVRWFALALCVGSAWGCHGCHEPDQPKDLPLATVFELRGDSARRDFAEHREQWQRVDERAEFRLGDGLRTDAPSSAILDLANGAQLHVRTGTLIRFLVDGARDGEQVIDVVTGEALLHAGAKPIQLHTVVGVAVLAAGSKLLLTQQDAGLRLRLEVGEASIRNQRGDNIELEVGNGILLAIGATTGQPRGRTPDAGSAASDAATVVQVRDDGVHTRKAGEREWHALARGEHTLPDGSALRLAADSSARLARAQDHAELHGAGDYVLGPGTRWISVARGELRLDAVTRDVEVVVPGGRIIAHAAAGGGSSAAVRVGDGDGSLDVERGSITFMGERGTREIVPGSTYRWSFPGSAQGSADATNAPDHANFLVSVGESFVVHAPEVPVAVSFDFAHKCSGDGIVELVDTRQRTRGAGRANLALAAGSRSYTVRCVDARGVVGSIVARGAAQVLRDAGTRKLPPLAPTSEIVADGRSYTIFYQNQLPNVRLVWPNAPQADVYQLQVDGTSTSVSSPQYVFPSGTLRDGSHRLTLEAAGRRSRTAQVTVRFDNTTATASLSAPTDRSFTAGDTVHIEGVALPAWKVSLQGGTIDNVADDRFRGEVVTSLEHPDIAVRLAHPRLGTHYYLRRAAGSP
jgi:hypothetical protein